MKVDTCRLCKAGKLSSPVLDFGSTPLANEFLSLKQEQDIFPLQVCVCQQCGHYQLNEQVSPERMFRHYLFVAGTSPVNIQHFKQYAAELTDYCKLKQGNKVLDIASNDGTLLKEFQKLGMKVLGIDPAVNIAEQANKEGIETIPEFFTEKYADTILKKYGKFELITANNVWAHVPDMMGFVKGVNKLLSDNGVFTFEVSYFLDVCQKTLIDTVYHEHTSYHTISPLVSFFKSFGLYIFNIQQISNHGGSIRVFVKKWGDNIKAAAHQAGEEAAYKTFYVGKETDIANDIEVLKLKTELLGYKLREKLHQYKSENKSIAIYGVPAKATTLMYALNIDEKLIDFAVDDNPLKQGTFTPGKHIPVLPSSILYERKPDIILVLAWNFYESILAQHKALSCTWIIPIPEILEINL